VPHGVLDALRFPADRRGERRQVARDVAMSRLRERKYRVNCRLNPLRRGGCVLRPRQAPRSASTPSERGSTSLQDSAFEPGSIVSRAFVRQVEAVRDLCWRELPPSKPLSRTRSRQRSRMRARVSAAAWRSSLIDLT